MLISIVIPAYNASGSIDRTLRSIFSHESTTGSLPLEVIVVDDGSADRLELERVVSQFPVARIEKHPVNLGMCAARNTGIAAASGRYVTLLDADDEYVSGWQDGFRRIIAEWPAEANVVFTPCINDSGKLTCSNPEYTGWLTAADLVQERYSGEYNPIFRGEYIRSRGYVDLKMRKSCGLLTYLKLSQEAPFWISDVVQRIYHDAPQSVSSGWTRPEKASETGRCFNAVLSQQGGFIKSVSDVSYKRLQYKALIYEMLAGKRPSVFALLGMYSWRTLPTWAATFGMLLLGPRISAWALKLSKRIGAVRRYG